MKPASLYRKGYRGEKRAREELERMGYFVVESRGSRGPIDLVAFPPAFARGSKFANFVRLIQVKVGRPPDPATRAELRKLALSLGVRNCLVECWVYRAGARRPEFSRY